MTMSGYTKLFNTILASTIWDEPDHVRIVWITLLAMADKDGVAEGSIPGLAKFARVSRKACDDALRRLSAPDKDSRTQEDDGRRIETVDGGWQILNHAKYRAKLSEDDRREYDRKRKAKYRAEKREVLNVPDSHGHSAKSAQAEADTKANTDTKAKTTAEAEHRGGGLILSPRAYAKLQESHAFVGTNLRVPKVLHAELIAKSGANADAELRTWYGELDADLEQSGKGTGDVFVWLRPRHQAFAVSKGWIDAAPVAPKPNGAKSFNDELDEWAKS